MKIMRIIRSKKVIFLFFLLCFAVPILAQRDSTSVRSGQDRHQSKMKKNVDLNEVVVNGVSKKLVVKEDTFIYNADAYKTPEGSTIEELVRRLPGATIDDSGNITINGKTVKKIKVDGKEFMTGDTQTAMKNLPTSIIEKVKAYDEKSDLAKMTGVDDGEEETVLDFGIRKGMNKGLLTNIDLSVGTKSRYAERAMGAYMMDDTRLMIFGNLNNTNDRGFTSGGRGPMGGGDGLQTNKMVAANYNYEKKDKLKVDFNVRWRHENSDVYQLTNTENFVSTQSSFSNSESTTYGRNNSWDLGGRLEWQIDSLTKLVVRPNYTGSSKDSRSLSYNGMYNDEAMMDTVNYSSNNGVTYTTGNSFNVRATISRKLAANGRNVTFQGRYSVSDQDDENMTRQMTELYKLLDYTGLNDSVNLRNRYTVMPTNTWSYRLNATYMEPIAKATFIQLRYQYEYTNRKSDRVTDSLDYAEPPFFADEMPEYRSFEYYLAPYQPVSQYRSARLSRNSEDDNYRHEIELSLKRTTKKYNLNVGVMVQPQISRLTYQGASSNLLSSKNINILTSNGEYTTVVSTRTTTNVTPTLDFKYKWNKRKTLRVNYRGSSSQPSMTDLLPIYDDSNPLNVKYGNPDLLPSFTNMLRLNYNNYVASHLRTIMAFLNYQNTRNDIANKTYYDGTTGGKITQPENINGNWNIEGAFMLNTALDSVGNWNLNSFSNVSYRNYASYAYLEDTQSTEENWTRSTNFSERLGGSYRNSWMEAELNGQVQYTVSRNFLQPDADMDTWQFQYGTDLTFNLPWNMSISTGVHMSSRRGYSEESMNTNEFIWNAQISQSFLKGKALTLSLQFNDILNQKDAFSRTISAIQRNDTWSNNINSYCMLHVIYRFNSFGGKKKRGPFGDRDGRPDGPPDGPPPGDFHGGPPPGGHGGFGGPPPGGGHF